ncbi:hypothetical protein [Anaeroselena agilis]|uniref:Uncharacterized protein n=1 Tax=Anaeroselena agilis TaxID=3063788 RepID=A0ABU3P2G1_9FIRM|nr:hypothetical protein [Selenomonadales bacterium 4137-cl]
MKHAFVFGFDFGGGDTGFFGVQINTTGEEPYGDTFKASRNFDGDANLDFGLTFGIGNKWALQYRQYNPAGTIWSGRVIDNSWSENEGLCKYNEYVALSFEGKLRSDEFNLMYSLNKNWAAFAGVVRSSASIKTTGSYGYSHIHDDGSYS